MKHLLPFLILSFFLFAANGQNLVPNPSFEDTLNCSSNFGRVSVAYPWFSAQGTPDYCTVYSSCSNCVSIGFNSYQLPRTGNAYAGLYLYQTAPTYCVREYIEVELLQPLDSGYTYCISWYMSRHEAFEHAVANIGAVLTADSLFGEQVEICNIEIEQSYEFNDSVVYDTAGWVYILGEFEANGTERFLTIGNFLDNETTIIDTVGGQNFGGYYFIDDVSLEKCETVNQMEEEEKQLVTIHPNPTTDLLFIDISSTVLRGVTLFDCSGRLLSVHQPIPDHIDVSKLNSGIYFLLFESDTHDSNRVFIKR